MALAEYRLADSRLRFDVQVFNKPTHVTTDKSHSFPSTLLSLSPQPHYTHVLASAGPGAVVAPIGQVGHPPVVNPWATALRSWVVMVWRFSTKVINNFFTSGPLAVPGSARRLRN